MEDSIKPLCGADTPVAGLESGLESDLIVVLNSILRQMTLLPALQVEQIQNRR
jgi:hypothetical protein